MNSRAAQMSRALCLLLLSVPLLSCNTAAVKKSYMALDAEGNRKRSVFFTDTDSIYCIGELAVGRKDVSVEAALRSTALALPTTGELVPIESVIAVKDVSPASTGSDVKVSFQLLKVEHPKDPWQAGKFVCDLSIDGVVETSTPFEIQYPPCPFQPPIDGEGCAGFFLPQSVCPGAIAPQSCTCTDLGAWQCN